MTIGVFDSGLGGLLVAKAVRAALPDYDYIYLGDTLHVPYGGRSREAIYDYSRRAVDTLFHGGCELVIVACNTASASALRQLQQSYLKDQQPAHRRILGVVVPTLEEAVESGYERIGLLGTQHLVGSDIYAEELAKLNPQIQLTGQAAPLLVPLIEHNGMQYAEKILQDYLDPLLEQDIQALILGCTHYPLLKPLLRKFIPDSVKLLSQQEIIPAKLQNYLHRHPALENRLSKQGRAQYWVTDLSDGYLKSAEALYGASLDFQKVVI